MSDTAPTGATWTPVPLSPEYVELITRNRVKIEAMAAGGVFDVAFGTATVNFASGSVQNININKRTYNRDARG